MRTSRPMGMETRIGAMLQVMKRLAALVVVCSGLVAGGNAAPPLPAAGAGAAGAWAAGAQAQGQPVKRLILTDGSYQAATEWKKVGDRLKYFSAERGEWEEIPAALVDWKATDEWNAVRAKAQTEAEDLKPVTGDEVAARKEEQLNTPLVAPELRLPADGGVILFAEMAGKPALQKLDGSKVEVHGNEGKTLLKRSIIPVASQVQTIELKGAEAKVRVHSAVPEIYLDVENDRGPIAGDNFKIVRLEKKRDKRMVAKNTVQITGEEDLKEKFLLSRAERFSGEWWKMMPLENLAPGEYAIVSTVPGQDIVVWDFGVEK